MQILDGKQTSETIKQEILAEVEQLMANGGKRPHLAAIIVGHDGASETYVANKVKACRDCGFDSTLLQFEDSISEAELLNEVKKCNRNEEIDGIIVQLPLPHHINEHKIIEAIDYKKDVDGFHPENVGRLYIGMPCYISATPKGILELLTRYHISTKGKKCVVLGRSNIVGKPTAALMMQKDMGDATVTILHSHSQNLKEECLQADILVTAIGQPHFVTADMIKPGAVILDIGITRIADASRPKGYRLMGDVDFDNVAPKCSFITPVPGGVGPMTVSMLMLNTLAAAKHTYFPKD